jgi:hypothetical protein
MLAFLCTRERLMIVSSFTNTTMTHRYYLHQTILPHLGLILKTDHKAMHTYVCKHAQHRPIYTHVHI